MSSTQQFWHCAVKVIWTDRDKKIEKIKEQRPNDIGVTEADFLDILDEESLYEAPELAMGDLSYTNFDILRAKIHRLLLSEDMNLSSCSEFTTGDDEVTEVSLLVLYGTHPSEENIRQLKEIMISFGGYIDDLSDTEFDDLLDFCREDWEQDNRPDPYLK